MLPDCKSVRAAVGVRKPPRMFRRICNPTEVNIRFFNPIKCVFKVLVITAFIGLQILIFHAAGLQIRQSCGGGEKAAKNVQADLQSD